MFFEINKNPKKFKPEFKDLEEKLFKTFVMESLILAQNERWRCA